MFWLENKLKGHVIFSLFRFIECWNANNSTAAFHIWCLCASMDNLRFICRRFRTKWAWKRKRKKGQLLYQFDTQTNYTLRLWKFSKLNGWRECRRPVHCYQHRGNNLISLSALAKVQLTKNWIEIIYDVGKFWSEWLIKIFMMKLRLVCILKQQKWQTVGDNLFIFFPQF